MSLAQRVKTARKDARLTQAELARAVKQSRAAVSLWENGSTQQLSVESAIAAAEALGVSLKWLVFGTGPQRAGNLSASALALARAFDQMAESEQAEVLGYARYILSRNLSSRSADSTLDSLLKIST
jgi:DNA-binding XRE family transcriptional regulator